MDPLVLVIGTGIVSFFLLIFSHTLDESHYLLKLLSLFFALGILIMIPKAALDSRQLCESVINTTMTNTSTNVTAYTYTTYCHTTSLEDSSTSFYKSVVWFYRIFMAYVIVALGYYAIMALADATKLKSRRK